MLDERITLRTEEYVCPATGDTKVRTVEYIEKVIEKEVQSLQKHTLRCTMPFTCGFLLCIIQCLAFYTTRLRNDCDATFVYYDFLMTVTVDSQIDVYRFKSKYSLSIEEHPVSNISTRFTKFCSDLKAIIYTITDLNYDL